MSYLIFLSHFLHLYNEVEAELLERQNGKKGENEKRRKEGVLKCLIITSLDDDGEGEVIDRE